MKNKKITAIILLAAVALLAGYLFVYGNNMSYNAVLKANWGISLPYSGEEIFAKEIPEESFNGDGERYRVFRYKETPVFGKDIVWSDSVAKETRLVEIVDNMQPDFVPDFSSEPMKCFHLTGERDARDKLWVIYDEASKLVFVVEDFF